MRAKPWWRSPELAVAALGLLGVPATVAATAGVALEPAVVGVVLNGSLVAESLVLHQEAASRQFWLPVLEAQAWRLVLAGRRTQLIEGREHVAFCGPPAGGERCFYDETSALFTMNVAGSQLQPLQFAPQALPRPEAGAAGGHGGWLNYDVSAWRVGRPGMALQLDGRVFAPEGFGAVRVDAVHFDGKARVVRHAALWQTDLPDRSQTVQMGNVSMPDTSLATGMPLLGLRWGSNPRLRPDQSLALRPRYEAAAAPRSLRADVFVDGLYRQTAEVPYGPYSVEVVPALPGRGRIDVVTTDLSGAQQRSSVAFYQAPQMLAPGALEWSVDAGLLEDARGRTSRHGLRVVGASARTGIDSSRTAQAQLLVAEGVRRLAMGVDVVDAQYGLSTAGLVLQRSPLRPQHQAWLTLGQELMTRRVSASVLGEWAVAGCDTNDASARYDRFYRPCRRVTANAGADLGAQWSVAAALQSGTASRSAALPGAVAAQAKAWAALASVRWQSAARHQLSIGVQRASVAGRRQDALQIGWSMPLSGGWQGQASVQQRQGSAPFVQWAAQRTPTPDDPNLQPLQAYGASGPRAYVGGRVVERGAAADWRLEARVSARAQEAAAGVAGACGWVEGRWFTSRRINDAFVLVDAGLPNLPVLLDNREVARTNTQGWALVTEARAWQANTVGVDIAALPIEYSMPRDQTSVVPRSGSGALARFDISDGGIALAVRDEAGQRLPAGAGVTVSSQRLGTAVTSRSEIFIDRSDVAADIRVALPGRACVLRYEPKSDTALHTCLAS